MARICIVNFISLDGVIQSPLSPDEDRDGGFDRGGWVPPFSDAVVNAFMAEATVGATGFLFGRRTYEIMHAAWSTADDSEPAVAAMNRLPKYVVSSAEGELEWANSRRLSGELADTLGEVGDDADGDLVVFGSATLCRALLAEGLVDRLRLLVFPLVLGTGKRMFATDGPRMSFTLTDSAPTPGGVAILSFERSGWRPPARAR